MAALTQPLRDEHAELFPHIEGIRRVADAVGMLPSKHLRAEVAGIQEFLTEELLPHARAEEATLYPAVARIVGAPEAAATMIHEHDEIADLVEQLRALDPELMAERLDAGEERALRRILYGLYTLVKVHFESEELVFLPLLDARLSKEEAKDLFAAMERAAAGAKASR